MKKILSNIYLLAALFVLGAAITSCSKSDDTLAPEPKPVGPTTYTMTIKATKGGDAKTRALNLDGNTLTASWSTSENVYVQKGSDWATGSLKPQADGGTAVLKGSLSGITIAENDNLFLQFPKSGDITYEGQLGTLNDIEANFDWATASVDVESVSASGNIIPKAATTTFTNQQAIVKFTLIAGTTKLNPTIFAIDYGTGIVSLTDIPAETYTTNGDGVLFVAFPAAGSAKTITLTAIVGNNVYTYQKENVTFSNGNYYAINVKMTQKGEYTGVYYPTPLTLECCATDGTASIWVDNYYYGNLYYKVDNGGWKKWPDDINNTLDLTSGQKVSFRGYWSTTQGLVIHCNDDCYIYGNIMSLLSEYYYAWMTTLPYDNTFKELFKDNANITHRNGYDLVLPATTLGFQCYSSMFYGCTNLQQAPELPASTIPEKAYSLMFFNCSSLKYIKCLANNTTANECTYNWLYNVAESGTFVVNSSLYYDQSHPTTTIVKVSDSEEGATVWGRSDSGIPSGWTVSDR